MLSSIPGPATPTDKGINRPVHPAPPAPAASPATPMPVPTPGAPMPAQSMYAQEHAKLSALPTPHPNEFLQWFFSSNAFTEHQKELVRAYLSQSGAANGGNNPSPAGGVPGTQAGTPAAGIPAAGPTPGR